MGIRLESMQINGSGSNTVSPGATSGGPHIYNVDFDAVGNSVLLTGNWNNENGLDGPNDNGDGNYSVIGQPSFGNFFNVNSEGGNFSWQFTRAQAEANGGINQTIEFSVSGVDSGNNPFTDTVRVNLTCFLTGTKIATLGGEVAVEDLAVGDMIRTKDGREVAVKWVGKQSVSTLWGMAEQLMPVRFRAGSLGGGLPHTDLLVTADHAMLVDDLLCNAATLVNGRSIEWVPLAELGTSYDIYHVETEAHEVILANGAPSESFIDVVGRRSFDNYQEFLDLYGVERIIPEMPCPRISATRLLPASLKARLAEDNEAAGVIHFATKRRQSQQVIWRSRRNGRAGAAG